MRILFDHGVPRPLIECLASHAVMTAQSLGWDTLRNGELILAAERAGFDVLLTTDKNMRYQQSLTNRGIAVVVLENAQWPFLKNHVAAVESALHRAEPGHWTLVQTPPRD